MRHVALLTVHYSARLLASTASLGTRVTASAEVGALGSRGEEHRALPGEIKLSAAPRRPGHIRFITRILHPKLYNTCHITNYFTLYLY